MNKKKLVGMIISFLIITIFYLFYSIYVYREIEKSCYEKTAQLIACVIEANSEMEQVLISSLNNRNIGQIHKGKEMLEKYGYGKEYIINSYNGKLILKISIGSIVMIFGFFFCFVGLLIWLNILNSKRISNLAKYIYDINEGNYKIIHSNEEDEFTILEDEIYKTIGMLKESREKEKKEKIKLSNNLADISHQLKTPLTSMSLMIELLENSSLEGEEMIYIEILTKQIDSINHLVSSLLVLSKLDVGILMLENKSINTYELLCASVETLVIMIKRKEQQIFIEENGDVFFKGDFHWSNQAILNIVKNCHEHTPRGGEIELSYEQNPIYTQIIIEDNGEGFCKKDIPHLFTRFYKGENSSKDSHGIGLALAKSIIKRQNGEIRAENKKTGGVRFIIKFYSN